MKRFIILVLLLSSAFSDVIICNSKDWRDVFLIGYYSALSGHDVIALHDANYAKNVVPHFIDKEEKIVVFYGKEPVVKNYASFLAKRGYRNVIEQEIPSMFNLPGFFNMYSDTVVVTTQSRALIAGPLAYKYHAILLIIDRDSREEVSEFVKGFDKVFVIGYEGRSLSEINGAEIISTGNRVEDSIKVAERIPSDQLYIMSGLFLYLPIRSKPLWANFPVLISPTDHFPDSLKKILEGKKAIVLVGPEMDKIWSEVKKMFPKKRVMHLFAVGYAGIPGFEEGEMYPPPAIFLPEAEINIVLQTPTVFESGRVVVPISNNSSVRAYVLFREVNVCGTLVYSKMPITIPAEGETSFIADISPISEKECAVKVSLLYGAEKGALERKIEVEYNIPVQKISDRSYLEIKKAVYSPAEKKLKVVVLNNGPTNAWFEVWAHIFLDGLEEDLVSKKYFLAKGCKKTVAFDVYMTDADLLDNEKITLSLLHGETKTLVKKKVFEMPLEVEKDLLPFIVTVAVALILILLALKKRKKYPKPYPVAEKSYDDLLKK